MKTESSGKKQLLIIGSVVIILICGINLARMVTGGGGGSAGFDPTGIQEEVGRALGSVTAVHLGESGTVVILAVDDSQSQHPYAKEQAAATEGRLKDYGITVQDTVWLQANQILPEMGVMTIGLYMDTMAPYQDVDGIVSLAGIPALDPTQAHRDMSTLTNMPPLYCLTRDRTSLDSMMRSGLIKGAVCEKKVDTSNKAPKKAKEWFPEVSYEVITSPPESGG